MNRSGFGSVIVFQQMSLNKYVSKALDILRILINLISSTVYQHRINYQRSLLFIRISRQLLSTLGSMKYLQLYGVLYGFKEYLILIAYLIKKNQIRKGVRTLF